MRPKTVPVVAAFLFLATVMALVSGVSLLFPGTLLDRLWKFNESAAAAFRPLGRVAGVPLLALGIATTVAGVGLLRRKSWAWWFAVGLFAANGLGDLAALILTHDRVKGGAGVAVAGGFLFCLTRPKVRRYFIAAC